MTTDFFGNTVTRLILGDNPFNGFSYIKNQVTGEEMDSYYTKEKILETLFEAEKLGLNAMLPLASPKMLEALTEYFNKGGSMKIIFQPYQKVSVEENLENMLRFKPIAVYHQGTITDNLNENNQTEVIRSNIKIYKSAGIPVGLGTHVPETVMQAESEGWGADFYVTCLCNPRKSRHELTKTPEEFNPEDRFLMYEVIRKISKPCIMIKIFAGGQIFSGKTEAQQESLAESRLREIYANIKPGDFCAVGVFQRDKKYLKLNAGIVSKISS